MSSNSIIHSLGPRQTYPILVGPEEKESFLVHFQVNGNTAASILCEQTIKWLLLPRRDVYWTPKTEHQSITTLELGPVSEWTKTH